MSIQIIQGDVFETIKTIPDGSVQCCVTSPPYYGLRDYGVSGQIGLESTPKEYIAKLVSVFREVKRVLKDDGTLWVNIGDSYCASPKGSLTNNTNALQGKVKALESHFAGSRNDRTKIDGLKPKDLIGIPWMLAFALRDDGWYLRSEIIWAKRNCMPESVKDRPTKSHEQIFLLAKSQKYYYDYEAITEPMDASTIQGANYSWSENNNKSNQYENNGIYGRSAGKFNTELAKKIRGFKTKEQIDNPQHHGNDIITELPGRNARDVWWMSTKPYKEAHFATFPPELPEKCIKAGSRIGDVILDPFMGSGTTGAVAIKYGRNYIGCELNEKYIELTYKRLRKVQYSIDGLHS